MLKLSGRAPTVLMANMVQVGYAQAFCNWCLARNFFSPFFLQTVEKFLQLSATALLHAPPVPPVGFWLGALLLAAGSAAYLAASNVPQSASRTKTAKIKQT